MQSLSKTREKNCNSATKSLCVPTRIEANEEIKDIRQKRITSLVSRDKIKSNNEIN